MIGAEERQRVLQKYDDGNWRRDPTTNSWGRVPQFISHRSATGHGHTVEEAKRGQLERKYVWVTADGYPFGSEEPPPPPPLEEERRKLVAAVPSAPPLELKLTRRLHGRDERLADTSARKKQRDALQLRDAAAKPKEIQDIVLVLDRVCAMVAARVVPDVVKALDHSVKELERSAAADDDREYDKPVRDVLLDLLDRVQAENQPRPYPLLAIDVPRRIEELGAELRAARNPKEPVVKSHAGYIQILAAPSTVFDVVEYGEACIVAMDKLYVNVVRANDVRAQIAVSYSASK